VEGIRLGLKVMCFLEHAPFVYDCEHRLSIEEAYRYIADVRAIQERYRSSITLLAGLEVDYAPSARRYVAEIRDRYECDYMACGVHFIEDGSSITKVWDEEGVQRPNVLRRYFEAIADVVHMGGFDAIVHPDVLMRAGVQYEAMRPHCEKVCGELAEAGMACEVNLGGPGGVPNCTLAAYALRCGVPVVLGSDAHCVGDLPRAVNAVQTLVAHDISTVAYYCARKRTMYDLRSVPR
jgi:histidinol-phosphatase (PHP family)